MMDTQLMLSEFHISALQQLICAWYYGLCCPNQQKKNSLDNIYFLYFTQGKSKYDYSIECF